MTKKSKTQILKGISADSTINRKEFSDSSWSLIEQLLRANRRGMRFAKHLHLLFTLLTVEPHDRLPHSDYILRIHPFHLAELGHDLLVVLNAFLLESGQDIFREIAGEHLSDGDNVDDLSLSLVGAGC